MRVKIIILLLIAISLPLSGFAQSNPPAQDSTGNNLIHLTGYKTGKYGALPQYVKAGKGNPTLILIPGWGFDASVFKDFMDANKNNYTMYAITIPGYGKTQAPPMPDANTSYGQQYWNKGALEGLNKLIEKEKLQKPVIVGNFTQGAQLALRMAIDYPDKVGGVIVLGGQAKFIAMIQGEPREFPLDTMINYTDKYTAPVWFKPISKKFFDNNNYLPEIYSLDSTKGAQLWKQSAAVPLPVMVRYICEFFASDIKTELDKIKCPVLILRATYNDSVLQNPVNNYVKSQFINTWNDVSVKNPLIKVKDIKNAAGFVWKDNPAETYKAIDEFLK